MKKILCYGDSNTFGYNPCDASRYDTHTRWTAVLQNILGNEYKVIEEGMCDRTGIADNDKGFLFSAQRHFPKLMPKTKEVDILVLWIGTNDLQFKYNLSLEQIEKGLEKLIIIAQNYAKKIILIPSVELSDNILDGYFRCQFDSESVLKSKEMSKIYKKLRRIYNLEYFDINEFVRPSEADGLHYDTKGHTIIAQKLSEFLVKI